MSGADAEQLAQELAGVRRTKASLLILENTAEDLLNSGNVVDALTLREIITKIESRLRALAIPSFC